MAAASVGVTIPPRIPPKITTGISNARAASFKLTAKILGVILISILGKFRRRAMIATSKTCPSPMSTPGMRAPAKRAFID